MERLEVKQKIASLVKELEELDTKIIDPIERSEYKQQLNKQLRLLKKREILAEIEQEQKDLQSIQSESSLNQDSLADNSQVLASTLQQDNTHTISNEFSTETKLQQDTQVNQVDESSYEELPSNISLSQSIHSTTTSDNSNSNKSGRVWIKIKPLMILGLIFGTFVITAFIINSNSTRQAEEARLQELARQETIKARQETEKARQERIKAEQERQAAIRAKEKAEKARQEAILAQEKAREKLQAEKTNNTEFPSGNFSDDNWLISLWYENSTYHYKGTNLRTGDSISLQGVRVSGSHQRHVYTWKNGNYLYQVTWQPRDFYYIRLQVFDPNGKQLLNRLLTKN